TAPPLAEGLQGLVVRLRTGRAGFPRLRVHQLAATLVREAAVPHHVERRAEPRVAGVLRGVVDPGAAADQPYLGGERLRQEGGDADAADARARVGAAQLATDRELGERVGGDDHRAARHTGLLLEAGEAAAEG